MLAERVTQEQIEARAETLQRCAMKMRRESAELEGRFGCDRVAIDLCRYAEMLLGAAAAMLAGAGLQ